MVKRSFDMLEAEAEGLVERSRPKEGEEEADPPPVVTRSCIVPAYELVLKCSNLFNVLDARGALSVRERATYIGRVRNLARGVARAYVAQREALGYPLLRERVEA
jgi:glycyl-tRNA synthetase alpha chain